MLVRSVDPFFSIIALDFLFDDRRQMIDRLELNQLHGSTLYWRSSNLHTREREREESRLILARASKNVERSLR